MLSRYLPGLSVAIKMKSDANTLSTLTKLILV